MFVPFRAWRVTTHLRRRHNILAVPETLCSNGVLGVERDGICCDARCGTCGGRGCSSRPGSTVRLHVPYVYTYKKPWSCSAGGVLKCFVLPGYLVCRFVVSFRVTSNESQNQLIALPLSHTSICVSPSSGVRCEACGLSPSISKTGDGSHSPVG